MSTSNVSIKATLAGLICLISSGTVVECADLDVDFRVVGIDRLKKQELTVTRLDWFVTGLGLQRLDGSWLDASEDWVGFYRLDGTQVGSVSKGLPAENFKAMRFRIGLSDIANKSDPNVYPVEHPLHPDLNGLHWGWQEGYIFLAVEGQWMQKKDQPRGYSYHLANDSEAMLVELPVEFSSAGPVTIQLDLSIDKVLDGISPATDGTSTHSREGDPLAKRLMRRVTAAVGLRGVRSEIFQKKGVSRAETASTSAEAPPPGTASYEFNVSQRFPQLVLPPDNPLTVQGVALGKRLFHDKTLSKDGSQACSSCHFQAAAFSDPKRFSIGVSGVAGNRQAMPLFNLAWAGEFFWDGRAKRLRDQVYEPIEAAHEMNESLERVVEKLEGDATYSREFANAFGSEGVSKNRIGLAFEQFLLTLVSQDSKFDRAIRKQAEFTEREKRGFQLFVTEFDPSRGLRGADCFHCHGGTLFTNHRYFDNGLDLKPADEGRMAVTGSLSDLGKFKTPSLRNIAVTAPYMHDGRFKTLEEVVDHYSVGVNRSPNLDPNISKHPDEGLQLTKSEKADLIAFLKTLTDEAFVGAN